MDKTFGKNLYKCSFNYYGEASVLHLWAYSDLQAFHIGCIELAKRYSADIHFMTAYFRGTNKYKITLIKEEMMKVTANIEVDEGRLKELVKEGIEQYINSKVFSSHAPRQGASWTREEDEALKEAFIQFTVNYGMNTGRSYGSIKSRIKLQFDNGNF